MDIEDIKNFAYKSSLGAHRSHDWSHTRRVYDLCVRIGQAEKADMEVLTISAYLHDVGRSYEDKSKGKICHAEKGAEIASDLLKNSFLSENRKKNVIHSIRSHRFRGNHKPKTLEAKILFDADKLDSIGAVGIGRTFQFAGEVGARLHNPDMVPEDCKPYSIDDTAYREFILKLSKIKDRIITTEGRKIAKERHEFMDLFFRRFIMEYNCAD
jgi:uncharacterized protein